MITQRFARLAAAALVIASPAGAQSLSQRVASAPDGLVQFTFAARAGVCGNGRTFISTGPNSYVGSFYGTFDESVRREPCANGPVRVVLNRADRNVIDVKTYVGPADKTAGANDLGAVPAREAADFLLSLASKTDGRPGRDAIFPAMLADSAQVQPQLLTLARDQSRSRETRSSAISWLGRDGEERNAAGSRVASALAEIAKDATDNQQVRRQAMGVLSRLDRGDGIPALIEISRTTGDAWLAKQSMSTLANSGDPRARTYLRAAAGRTDLVDEVRTAAIRGIGHDYATSDDAAFLRSLYPKLSSETSREAVIESLVQMGGAENVRWLTGVAKDESATSRDRRRALGGLVRAGASTADLVSLYDGTKDADAKGAIISALVQSGDKVAVDKLISIAKTEEDRSVRRRVITSLSRSEDPRVKALLADLVER
ncbi:MAG: HEAT repeat domain-containing protein [Gemmatimonadaceae bacterium]